MNDIKKDKIDRHSDELEVESDEKLTGKKIELDEDRLPSRAMAIHEHIRQDGEKEMERDAMALLWSAIAAGLSMGASLLAKGIFHVQLEGVRLYLRLYYCHYGPPATLYRKYRHRCTAGDAKPYPRQFWPVDAPVERGSAG